MFRCTNTFRKAGNSRCIRACSACPSRQNWPAPCRAPPSHTHRSVYLDLDATAIRAELNPMLQAHARYLQANPKARGRIEGNADERGSAEYNQRLGMRRAESVRQAIIGHGASDKQVVLKSLGESRPKLKGHDEESWTENRRADVVYEKEN